MLGKLMQGAKDGALSLGLKSLVNDKMAQYGAVQDCSINTQNNTLELKALLKGEASVVNINLLKYNIEREGEDTYIALGDFNTSREWLTVALNRFLKGKRYKLPPAVTKLL